MKGAKKHGTASTTDGLFGKAVGCSPVIKVLIDDPVIKSLAISPTCSAGWT
jgi:hypothetical protein